MGRVQWSPAPDAEDRLRRLFTLLASHFAGNDVKPADQMSIPAGSPAEGSDE